MSSTVTYRYITQNEDINTYIKNADAAVEAQGYTEHSFAHVGKVASTVEMILTELDYPERQIELGKIAAYLHDIGNVINRVDHAQSGAVMAFRLLDNLNMPYARGGDMRRSLRYRQSRRAHRAAAQRHSRGAHHRRQD